MEIVRKIGSLIGAMLRYLWKQFLRLSWKGKALVIIVLIALADPASAMSLMMMAIVLGTILYMLKSLVKNLGF